MKTPDTKRHIPSFFVSLLRLGRLISGVALLALFLPALSHLKEDKAAPDLG